MQNHNIYNFINGQAQRLRRIGLGLLRRRKRRRKSIDPQTENRPDRQVQNPQKNSHQPLKYPYLHTVTQYSVVADVA